MKRIRSVFLKVTATVAVLSVVLLAVLAVLLNTSYVQNRVMKYATELLAGKLGTKVVVDSVDISVMRRHVALCGLTIEDQQQRQMLQMERLEVKLQLRPLLHRKLKVTEAGITGVDAWIVKPSKDSVANFQFLIDAFKKEKPASAADTTTTKGRQLSLDVRRLLLDDVHVKYNDTDMCVEHAEWDADDDDYVAVVSTEGLHFVTDNHKPRKNSGKPHRGFFDPGHLDVTASLRLYIHEMSNDTLVADLSDCHATDSVTGIDIRNLSTRISANSREMNLSDLSVQQGNTTLHVADAHIVLPGKDATLSYTTGQIKGHAILHDIARPFAPVLDKFKVPLNLSLTMAGSAQRIAFNDVVVATDDNLLMVGAHGIITDLNDKEKLKVSFHVKEMNAKRGMAEKIIRQFPVKRLMMKQLNALGTIRYKGDFSVFRKREEFFGVLRTAPGNLNFRFAVDGVRNYVSGRVNTPSFDIAKAMDMKNLGPVVCTADFSIDISKQRTAAMRRQYGGKLPIGSVNAQIEDCSFKKIHFRNLLMNINSNGAIAMGDLTKLGKWRDLYCSFSFTNTDQMQKLKIMKPGIKFHKKVKLPKKSKNK